MGKNVYKRVNGAWAADKYYQYQQNAETVENSKTIPIYSNSRNLFDYKAVYASYIDSDGNINTTANNLTAWNNFTQEQVGKELTVSFYCSSISSSYIRVQSLIDNEYITGNAVEANKTGYSTITVRPTSTSDKWRITYGSGTPAVKINQVMLNEGSTALPYEPYYKPLVSYSFEGQCNQASTPTPTVPVEVEEFGDLIPNLCTSTKIVGSNYAMYTPNISNYINDNDKFSVYIETDVDFVNGSIYLVTSSQQFTPATINTQNGKIEVTVDFTSGIKSAIASSTATVYFKLYKSGADFTNTTNVMIVTGSQVIPYGTGTNYKIPVTSAGQTQNIILSEPLRKIGDYADIIDSEGVVTRRIGKILLDGTERWGKESLGDAPNRYHGTSIITDCGNNLLGICSHYKYEAVNTYGNLFISSNKTDVFILDSNVESSPDLKTFLAQQYANGTPVTVYYVLATPTTESVTAPTIPTSSGYSNIEIGTSLAPSKFEYDLGKMFVAKGQGKVRQNGEWV